MHSGGGEAFRRIHILYERRPQRLEAFRVTAVQWKPEAGFVVTFDDGMQHVVPPRTKVPVEGDYWTSTGFVVGADFDADFVKVAS